MFSKLTLKKQEMPFLIVKACVWPFSLFHKKKDLKKLRRRLFILWRKLFYVLEILRFLYLLFLFFPPTLTIPEFIEETDQSQIIKLPTSYT